MNQNQTSKPIYPQSEQDKINAQIAWEYTKGRKVYLP